MGGAHERPAATRLLRQRVARRDGCRLARLLRRVLRDDWRSGLRLGRLRRHLGAHRPRLAGCPVGGGPNAAMIRVELPYHLRTLAGIDDDVEVQVDGPVTQQSVVDAIEARYPM